MSLEPSPVSRFLFEITLSANGIENAPVGLERHGMVAVEKIICERYADGFFGPSSVQAQWVRHVSSEYQARPNGHHFVTQSPTWLWRKRIGFRKTLHSNDKGSKRRLGSHFVQQWEKQG